jgi:hypothetical protein
VIVTRKHVEQCQIEINSVNCVPSWNYMQQNINMMHGPMNIKDVKNVVLPTHKHSANQVKSVTIR